MRQKAPLDTSLHLRLQLFLLVFRKQAGVTAHDFISLPALSWDFLSGIVAIILIDIVLAGDNALVIALAVKNLPQDKRRIGIILGASVAVLLRVVLTFFVSQLLGLSYVKLIGEF